MVNASAPIRFKDIIAPITEEEFFRVYHNKKPLHIPGDENKFRTVMNWSQLNKILNMTSIWSSKSMTMVLDRKVLAPAEFCSMGIDHSQNSTLMPAPEKVTELLKKGASVGLNDIDALTPELRDVADAFEEALNVKAQSNLYCSWHQRQAFVSHFDTHDVYAMHFEGTKEWRIYNKPEEFPIRHPRFSRSDEQFLAERGEIDMEITMRPGDLLYIPRGFYHDALASSEGCVHIAFGMTGVIGMDFLNAMLDAGAADPLFRRNFPRRQEGREAVRAHIKALAERVGEIADHEDFLDAFMNYLDQFQYSRGGYNLPIKSEDIRFQTTDSQFRVVQNGRQWVLSGTKGAVPIPANLEKPVEWIIREKQFARGDFTASFKSMDIEGLDRLLGDLQQMGVIRKD